MKFKKPRGLLFGIGIGAFVLAVVLFFLVPVICKEGFQYNGLDAILNGVVALGSLNFVNVLYTALVILFVLALSALLMYAVTAGKKKHGAQIALAVISLIFVFGSYIFISVYFLADVEFNGSIGKLLDSMLKANNQILGKVLSSIVLALAILSNVMLIVHTFVAIVSMVVTQEVNAFEEKCEAEAQKAIEEKAAELAAAQPVVCESAPEETVKVTTILAPEAAKDLEERKRKEELFFKECIDSGFFTEYEELEFPDAIEGVDEEPVYESSVVEEKSAFITRTSVHVGYTHD